MAFRHDNKPSVEQISAYLEDAVSKVKANPERFEELRRTFKKNVPLTLRSLVAAYILDQSDGAIFRFNNFKNRGNFQNRDFREHDDFRAKRRFSDENGGVQNAERSEFPQTQGEKHERYQHVEIDPSVAATVFIGIGKNRRVYPKDIVGLFISVAGIEKERIGDIKVYASYSFVQLFKDDADKAINALNGYDYRGRRLSVSYSRTRPSFEKNRADESEESVAMSRENSASDDVRAQQAAFASSQKHEMSDEEIFAARAPRSSSSEDV